MLGLLFALFIFYHVLYQIYWKKVKPDFKGKVVIITGASSGIGECLAYKMVKAGAKKLILSARRVPELDRVKKAC